MVEAVHAFPDALKEVENGSIPDGGLAGKVGHKPLKGVAAARLIVSITE